MKARVRLMTSIVLFAAASAAFSQSAVHRQATQNDARPGARATQFGQPSAVEWMPADMQPIVDDAQPGLQPRKPFRKRDRVVVHDDWINLVVKFHDQVRARADGDGTLTTKLNLDDQPVGFRNAMQDLNTFAAEHRVTFAPAIYHSEESLRALEQRVATYSGKAQPDLAGIQYVQSGDRAALEAIADELNAHPLVEYVHFERSPSIGISEPWRDDRGGNPACPGPTPCTDAFPESQGCSDEDCCNAVCALDPFCCNVSWDLQCAALAGELEDCVTDDAGPTPDFTGPREADDFTFQRYLYNISRDVPDPDDHIANDIWLGGFDLAGFDQLSQRLFDVGVGPAPMSRGETIKIGVVEFSYWDEHEDLDVTTEPRQTLIKIPALTVPDHGTASLGIVAALEDDKGCTGIAPEAEAWFFPTVSVEQGGRLFSAIVSMAQVFGPGDVASFSIGFTPNPLESDTTVALLFLLATDAGITTVQSAGNSCFNLDDTDLPGEETGSIIVGAGEDGPPFCRLGFSNHCQDCNGDDTIIVHVQAWGQNVTTLGYGNLFKGDNDNNRSYTLTYGGTSAAAPQIAGAVARLQSLAKQIYGIPLPPRLARSIVASGFPQCLIPIVALLPGYDNPPGACGGDTVGFPDYDEGPNRIGPFPNLSAQVSSVLNTNFFDSDSPIVNFELVRGAHLAGNVNSVRAQNGLFFIARSVLLAPGAGSIGPSSGQMLRYISPGRTTDVEVTVRLLDLDQGPFMTMNVFMTVDTPNFTILVAEVFDPTLRRFRNLGLAVVSNETVPGEPQEFPIGDVTSLMNGDGEFFVRLYTVGVGGSFVPTYRVFYDHIEFTPSFLGGIPMQ